MGGGPVPRGAQGGGAGWGPIHAEPAWASSLSWSDRGGCGMPGGGPWLRRAEEMPVRVQLQEVQRGFSGGRAACELLSVGWGLHTNVPVCM